MAFLRVDLRSQLLPDLPVPSSLAYVPPVSTSQNLKQEWKPQSQLLLRAHSKTPWKLPSTSLPSPRAMPQG